MSFEMNRPDIYALSSIQDELENADRWYWTQRNRYIKGSRWSFDNRAYLKQIYREKARELIFVKGRQVEASELAIKIGRAHV